MESESLIKHEFVTDDIFAMTGTSDIHNIIVGNLYIALREHLKGSPGQAFMSDLKLKGVIPLNSVGL